MEAGRGSVRPPSFSVVQQRCTGGDQSEETQLSTFVTHRVICADDTRETFSLASAQRHLVNVQTLGICLFLHTIEVRSGDDWIPLHIARAQEILAAPLGTVIDSPDGRLSKAAGSWSKETSERASTAVGEGADHAAWIAALGPHEDATLTADGRGAHVDSWCTCPTEPPSEAWTRYERWTAQGRAGHGYVCPRCRYLTQTG